MVQQPLSGIRVSTPDNLVFDAGVIYANINLTALENPSGGWEAAIASALAIGATRGNPTFNANREMREVEVNGSLGPTRGLVYRNIVRPTLTVSLIEMTVENLEKMIAGATDEETGKFAKISGAEIDEDTSYFDNIALAASIKSSQQPVVLVLKNVLVHNSPDFEFEDHNELGVEVEFVGHFPLTNTRDESECWCVYRPIEES